MVYFPKSGHILLCDHDVGVYESLVDTCTVASGRVFALFEKGKVATCIQSESVEASRQFIYYACRGGRLTAHEVTEYKSTWLCTRPRLVGIMLQIKFPSYSIPNLSKSFLCCSYYNYCLWSFNYNKLPINSKLSNPTYTYN